MQAICSMAAAILAIVNPTDVADRSATAPRAAFQQASSGSYKLPRLPTLPRLPSLPQLPRLPRVR